jgi:AraC-like DNA-binding protein
MLAIPLPFVIALLLVILLLRMLAQGEAILRPAPIFTGACILLVTAVGLRWTVDVQIVRFLQPVAAALLPSIAWFCFSDLRHASVRGRWLHFLPAALILILSATWRSWHPPIDLLLTLLYFVYGAALLYRAYAGLDSFEDARLTDASGAQKAAMLAGWLLIFSGAVDLLITFDFLFYQGGHAATIVGIANIVVLPVLAYAIAIIGRSVPDARAAQDQPASPEVIMAPPDDARIIDAIETIMRDKSLFRDPDLTLTRLARRLGIPARQISTAVNRLGRNVSQHVNEYRIKEAQRLLEETDLTVTSVMFECGFQTKSNFNREFARVTGMTPSDYRRSGNADYSAGRVVARKPITR